MTSFLDILWQHLPPLYRECDNGDLRAFLSIPAPTLDHLKGLMDALPHLYDPRQCPPQYLPHLAHLLGINGHGQDPRVLRRDIVEAVPYYRRKSTLPGIRRDLIQLGWSGEIQEAYPKALRLNMRARLNRAKVPGRRYGTGIYHVTSHNTTVPIREKLAFHHPAGTLALHKQQFIACTLAQTPTSANPRTHRVTIIAHARATFILNRHRLNNPHNKLARQVAINAQRITRRQALATSCPRAGVTSWRVWMARRPGLSLNQSQLNRAKFKNTWANDQKIHLIFPVAIKELTEPSPNLNQITLNQDGLEDTRPTCIVRYRKRLMIAPTCAMPQASKAQVTQKQWPIKATTLAATTCQNPESSKAQFIILADPI